MDLAGIILSLGLLIFLIYRGVSVLLVSPLMAMLAVLITGDMPVITAWTGPLMEGTAKFVQAYFPVFLIGSVFGIVMNASGAAKSIALWISKTMGPARACTAVIVASFLLVFGGVSVFVVVFAVLPIANNIFYQNDLPRRLIPAAIMTGSMPAYVAPGSAQFVNTIPMPVLGTNIYAAMLSGIIATVVWLVLATWYMNKQVSKARAAGEGYGYEYEDGNTNQSLPGSGISFVPIIIVMVGNFILTKYFEKPDVIEYFQTFGGVNSTWSIVISLCLSVVVSLIIFRKYITDAVRVLSRGASDSLLPIFNTGVQVGYGGVIKNLSVFGVIKGALLAIPGTKLITIAVTSAVIAGIVGSTSGGAGIVMQVFGHDFVNIAQAHDIPMEMVHRLTLFGCSVLDTLPHSGLIITLLSVCGLTHKESYKDIFIVICAFPVVSVVLLIGMGLMGIV